MDITFLTDAIVPITLGLCLVIGYIIKTAIPKIDNKYIPLIVGVLGLAINVWVNKSFNPEIALGGLMSGLASTGLYEAFRNLINNSKETE